MYRSNSNPTHQKRRPVKTEPPFPNMRKTKKLNTLCLHYHVNNMSRKCKIHSRNYLSIGSSPGSMRRQKKEAANDSQPPIKESKSFLFYLTVKYAGSSASSAKIDAFLNSTVSNSAIFSAVRATPLTVQFSKTMVAPSSRALKSR